MRCLPIFMKKIVGKINMSSIKTCTKPSDIHTLLFSLRVVFIYHHATVPYQPIKAI